LQAMILTENEKMVLTPTYHVFEMFKGHQGATVLATELSDSAYTVGESTIPAVSASASRAASGDVLLTLVNTDPNNEASLSVEIAGTTLTFADGRVLTADAVTAHNTFDQPDAVQPRPFDAVQTTGDALMVQLPPKSVVAITLR
ncbi:MAG: alpha-N-arabinofuranosidase, partial [Fibrella sp.]|nr:alpha-N-arabinofuranosidase [Armatimonadota bacterium]